MADVLRRTLADREPDLQVVGLDHDRRIGSRRLGVALRLGREQLARIGMLRRVEDLRSTGPCSTILPCVITQTRSAILRTMPRSWVMNSMDMPSSALQLVQQLRICACTVTSSAVVGSSAISSSGSLASAIAIITRWRCPPDSSCG